MIYPKNTINSKNTPKLFHYFNGAKTENFIYSSWWSSNPYKLCAAMNNRAELEIFILEDNKHYVTQEYKKNLCLWTETEAQFYDFP